MLTVGWPRRRPQSSPPAARRVVTGIIGFPLVVSGAFLVLFGLLFSVESSNQDASLGGAIGIFIAVFGVGIALLGAPFALAASCPSALAGGSSWEWERQLSETSCSPVLCPMKREHWLSSWRPASSTWPIG